MTRADANEFAFFHQAVLYRETGKLPDQYAPARRTTHIVLTESADGRPSENGIWAWIFIDDPASTLVAIIKNVVATIDPNSLGEFARAPHLCLACSIGQRE